MVDSGFAPKIKLVYLTCNWLRVEFQMALFAKA